MRFGFAMPQEGNADARAFSREQKAGALLAFRVRALGCLVIALTLLLRASGEALAFYLGMLGLLVATGWLFYQTTRTAWSAWRRTMRWGRFALVAADMAIITAALLVPAPGTPEAWPHAMQLRLGNVGFLFLFLAFSGLTYSPGLALWAGFAAGGAWLAGVMWILGEGGSFTRGAGDFAAMEIGEIIATLLDPNYVSVIAAAQEALLLLLVGAVIAAAVWRGRRQALRQIGAARERATLARYFSPDLAEELTHGTASLEEMKVREAAILFADIFGFTTHAEAMTPEETIAFLREFHALATAEVFAHRGTLNKFIGDEVMASFGAIHPMEAAPAAALACAAGIAARVRDWSEARVAAGLSPVRVGVGVHVGEVVVGNVGDARCLELAVLGDVVNVASRLQEATRAADACIVASIGALEAARAGSPELRPLLDRFGLLPGESVRGKTGTVRAAALRLPALDHAREAKENSTSGKIR